MKINRNSVIIRISLINSAEAECFAVKHKWDMYLWNTKCLGTDNVENDTLKQLGIYMSI